MAVAYISKYDSNKSNELDETQSKELCQQIATTVVDITLTCMPEVAINMMGGKEAAKEELTASLGTAEIIFQKMDSDRSGTLSKEEISKGLETFFVTAGLAEQAKEGAANIAA